MPPSDLAPLVTHMRKLVNMLADKYSNLLSEMNEFPTMVKEGVKAVDSLFKSLDEGFSGRLKALEKVKAPKRKGEVEELIKTSGKYRQLITTAKVHEKVADILEVSLLKVLDDIDKDLAEAKKDPENISAQILKSLKDLGTRWSKSKDATKPTMTIAFERDLKSNKVLRKTFDDDLMPYLKLYQGEFFKILEVVSKMKEHEPTRPVVAVLQKVKEMQEKHETFSSSSGGRYFEGINGNIGESLLNIKKLLAKICGLTVI